MTSESSEYKKRVEQQIEQYSGKRVLMGLPVTFKYWMRNYVVPKIQDVFGAHNVVDIYAREFIESCKKSPSETGVILSVGCGDGVVEVQIAKAMLKAGFSSFKFLATELSPIRLDRARAFVAEHDMGDYFDFLVVDVNDWNPEMSFSGVMAQHTLHHITELEILFDFINGHLEDTGAFVVVDMIGRNGHMRWPEALEYVERFWKILPEKYKFNHQFKKLHREFVNWDCSVSGFEGIRAQDILPLLVEKFDIDAFVGSGGFVDIIFERGYGHNFDPENEVDLAYISIMAELNDALLEQGTIKPTMIFSICRKKGFGNSTQKCFNGQTAELAIRPVD